jgi:decaprenylphospho-beta-D-ribofuranose 2-oxidase
MPITRREILMMGAAALTTSCGPTLRREACGADARSCHGGSAAPAALPEGGRRCELWAYDEIHCATAMVYAPGSLEELRALCAAIARLDRPPRVTFRGGGQALDSQALNDEVVIQLDRCKELTFIGEPREDERGFHIEVGGAARWKDIVAKTSARGLVPYSVVTASHATAGGTLAADCLSRFSPFVGKEGEHVRSFELLTIDGATRACSRDDPAPEAARLRSGVIGGFGYLGVITRLDLDLRRATPEGPGYVGQPLRAMTMMGKFRRRQGEPWGPMLAELRGAAYDPGRPWNEGLNRCPSGTGPGSLPWDAVSASIFLHGETECGDNPDDDIGVDQECRGEAVSQALFFRSIYTYGAGPGELFLYQNQPYFKHGWGLTGSTTFTTAIESMLFHVRREGCFLNELDDFLFFMANQISPMKETANKYGTRVTTIQQTFVLPSRPGAGDPTGTREAEQFLHVVARDLQGDAMRPSVADVIYLRRDREPVILSSTRNLEGFAISLCWLGWKRERWPELAAALRGLSRECARLGGRVHLVKNVEADADVLRSMYGPALGEFAALKEELDPKRILRNEFFDRLFGETGPRQRQAPSGDRGGPG